MKLQNLTVIFIIIIIPIILLVSFYIGTGLKTIKYQSLYDTGLLTATHDAIYAFELNTTNDVYSDNAETKRNILKSSVKAFEKGLANTCGISAYNTDEIEEYIPAIVFGMYDGFYLYAPSLNAQTGKYEHDLKNYVYYSETLDDGTVISYSLDNHITVSGNFGNGYEVKAGYLIDLEGSEANGTEYKGIQIDTKDESAVKYYQDAYYFTNWFVNTQKMYQKRKDGEVANYLEISDGNDPEDEDSAFVQHKRTVIKEKIENVLNSSITAYSKRTWGHNYKMPKLSEEDWQKIVSNISMITFFQGKSIGLTKYNGYCVLNSTNSNEYVNPNLMYFTDSKDEYHDIRCTAKGDNLSGYKVGSFRKRKVETEKKDADGKTIRDKDGNIEYEYTYKYKHKALACYHCINGTLNTKTSVYDYIRGNESSEQEKIAYWTSLAKERYNTAKLIDTQCVVAYKLEGLTTSNNSSIIKYGDSYKTTIRPTNSLTHRRPDKIMIMMDDKVMETGYTYNSYNGEITIPEVTGDVDIIASTIIDTSNNSATYATPIYEGQSVNANIDQARGVRVFKFTPTVTGKYCFYSADREATTTEHDPYGYVYDADTYSADVLDAMFLAYAGSNLTQYGNENGDEDGDIDDKYFNSKTIKSLAFNDDHYRAGWPYARYNFYIEPDQNLIEGHTYYLVVRTWNVYTITNISSIYVKKK